MSREAIGRRRFLTLSLGALLTPWAAVAGEIRPRHGRYAVELAILHDLFSFRMAGTIDEGVDRSAGRYEVTAIGEGAGIANRIQSAGRVAEGRWQPLHTTSWFSVRGREARSEVVYNYTQRVVEYHYRGETFFLRRVRAVDDRIALPEGVHVDDVLSACFNLADGTWPPEPDGVYRTWVVRRHKRVGEGPDDVDPEARGELVPLELRLVSDDPSGKSTALFDMTRFSSWAVKDRPARIVFGSDRRPELITSSLMLGTSVTIRLKDV